MGVNSSQGKGAFAYSLEFEGGTSTNVTFNEEFSIDDIDEKIVPVVEKITGDKNVQTQKVAGTNQVIIKTVTLSLDQREELNQAMVDEFKVDESLITRNCKEHLSLLHKPNRLPLLLGTIIQALFAHAHRIERKYEQSRNLPGQEREEFS